MEAQLSAARQIDGYCKTSEDKSKEFAKNPSETTNATIPQMPPSVESFTIKKSTLDAEIIWAMKCVNNHFSYKSCQDTGKLFAKMFPDSTIAKQFALGERKCSYIISFGLAPYFKSVLMKKIEENDHITLLFDETLNQSNQQKQLDILARYWDPVENEVHTNYLNSAFMGHSTADDILREFYDNIKPLNLSKILQISMDGPAVNWKFYDLLQKDIDKQFKCKFAYVGSCGLHILNNAFRKGVSSVDWNVASVLVSLYWLFKDSPARREDFIGCSSLKKLPIKYCTYRWLENVPSAERAILIWDDVKTYVRNVQIGKCTKPENKSFNSVMEATKDKLFPAKLNFFASVGKIILPFMAKYQSDKPLLPFFANEIYQLVENCLKFYKVLKSNSLDSLTSIEKLVAFDFSKKENYSSISKVSVGFIGDKLLKELLSKNEVTDGAVLSFRSDCQKFIIEMIKKLMEKCPANYAVVRNVSCLDPCLMSTEPERCITKFKNLLHYFSQINKVSDESCDSLILQFRNFLENVVKMSSQDFKNFDSNTMRLDAFLRNYFAGVAQYQELWGICKMVLVLSHGQATVERGFSINKKIESENLKDISYVSQRLVHDYVKNFENMLHDITINDEMRRSVASSRMKYEQYLLDQKQKQQSTAAENKRKIIADEINFMKQKIWEIEKEVVELEAVADDLAEKAEATKNLQLFMKSNNYRKTAKEKKEEIASLSNEIDSKKKLLNN